MGGFTIIDRKDGETPARPLFLLTIVAPDGDVTYLTTAAYFGAPSITYGGNTYLARIQKNDIAAITATGPQGYDSVSGFTLTLADADNALWMGHCIPHGWRGSAITLTMILWDVVANAYSTDSLQWSFIGGNPEHDHKTGQTTLDVTSATNFTRLKVPSIPLEYRCPWDFPTTAAQRAAALNDPTSLYYQCGYSPDISGGCGNYASGTTPFTACDFTRSGGPGGDPSVGCMARMGNGSNTSVAPDGDLSHDKAGNYTARFGGVTWIMPSAWSGKQYISGQKLFGFNAANQAIIGSYYNWVYGTQWVQGQVLAPAGDPNSLRSEVAVCTAAFGPASPLQVVVNGVMVTHDNSDVLFTWRFGKELQTYTGSGGRSGAINGDAYYSNSGHSGLGDPHGSTCVIEFVVPSELASAGSVPTVQILVGGPPFLNCYPIATAAGSGGEIGITFAAGVPDLNIGPGGKVFIAGNTWGAANGAATVNTAAYGPPGVITLAGTSATGSGTGGGVFYYHPADLGDSGYSISTQDSIQSQTAANPVWVAMDLMTWGNIAAAQFNAASWYAAAQIAAAQLTYVGADGNTYSHAQFKACLQLSGSQRQTLAQVLTGLRNSANLMIAPNSTTGLIDCYVKQTLYDQQPTAIPGSNDTTPRDSMPASAAPPTPSSGTPGYYAYLFNESNIEKDSFRITSTRIEGTPNTVSFGFQDEYNSYTQDSLTEIDPNAYTYSGDQEINVPVPMNAIPNFDQGTRQANVQLSEALYGNPRDDAGGSLYFEFTTNHRVIHLLNRIGYICGLQWAELGIGVSAPQAVRVISLKPDTDGEHWQVKAQWHNDEWYTYTYGQNPTPYQNNPLLNTPARPPYPWRPGQTIWGATDAMFPTALGFAVSLDVTQHPATINVSGNVPVNAQPDGRPPAVPMQATTGNTGGTITPGTYHLKFSSNGIIGPVSGWVTCVVPAGTNTNTITVSGIQWQSTATAIQPYIGTSFMNMRACDPSSYTGSVNDGYANPTTYLFTDVTPDGLGLPDINFSKFYLEEFEIIHGGIWGDTVWTVDGTGKILTFPEVTWTSNQWAGRVLSLYYRPGASPMPALNMVVSSSTADTLTMPSTGFQAGDVVVLRAQANIVSPSTIGDTGFANWYDPSGMTEDETGNLVQIISGTGAGYPPKTIASNTGTTLTIQGTWDVTPDATSVFIVIGPTPVQKYLTDPISNATTWVATVVVNAPCATTDSQQLLIRVSTADQDGKTSPKRYQPFREVYVPDVESTRTVTSSQVMRITDACLNCDPSGLTQPTPTTLTGDIDDATLSIPVAAGDNVTNGAYIQIGTERILIGSGAVPGACTLLADGRGGWGTTAASHTSTTTVDIPACLTITLLPADQIPATSTRQLVVNKSTPKVPNTATLSDINFVKIVAGGSDTMPDQILPDSDANAQALIVFPGV